MAELQPQIPPEGNGNGHKLPISGNGSSLEGLPGPEAPSARTHGDPDEDRRITTYLTHPDGPWQTTEADSPDLRLPNHLKRRPDGQGHTQSSSGPPVAK